MAEDITNTRLSRFISLEMLGSMLTIAFIFGIGYSSLSSENANAGEKINSIQAEQEKLSENVQQIKVDMAVIKNDQQYLKDRFKDQSADIKQMLIMLKKLD